MIEILSEREEEEKVNLGERGLLHDNHMPHEAGWPGLVGAFEGAGWDAGGRRQGSSRLRRGGWELATIPNRLAVNDSNARPCTPSMQTIIASQHPDCRPTCQAFRWSFACHVLPHCPALPSTDHHFQRVPRLRFLLADAADHSLYVISLHWQTIIFSEYPDCLRQIKKLLPGIGLQSRDLIGGGSAGAHWAAGANPWCT